MEPFGVLVVDNASWVRDRAQAELSALGDDVSVTAIGSVDEARRVIEESFFQVAFVDLHLNNQSGVSVIRDLNNRAPACRVVLMTRHLDEYAKEILGLMGDEFHFHGLIDKVRSPQEDELWFRPEVSPVVDEWRKRAVVVEGLGEVIEAISERRRRINRDLAGRGDLARLHVSRAGVAAELEYLLRAMFGGSGLGLGSSKLRLDLSLLRGGYSSSVVLEAGPSDYWPVEERLVPGNRCVVKIGARTEIDTEAERYRQVVRFGVELRHRVELLGHQSADALAAICYSFAGGNSAVIRSFDQVLQSPGEEWRRVLQELHSEDSRNWYATPGSVESLRGYFRRECSVPLERSLELLEGWLDHMADKCDFIRWSNRRLRVGKVDLRIPPTSALGTEGLTSRVEGCLVHGDMHAGNILLGRNGDPCLIDFRNAGLGPRLIDFSALQASARFAHVRCWSGPGEETSWPSRPTVETASMIAESVFAERALLVGKQTAATKVHWADVDREIVRLRGANFPDASDREAVYTNFAYCLSLARFVKMEWYRKLRLVAWLSALSEQLDDE